MFERVGGQLPSEYVALMNVYGPGAWCAWLHFVDPLHADDPEPFGLVTGLEEDYAEHRDEDPETYTMRFWPEPGGFLPFAYSEGADLLGWLTEGEPDAWPLVVLPREWEDQGPTLPTGLLDTLLSWCRGDYAGRGFLRPAAAEPPGVGPQGRQSAVAFTSRAAPVQCAPCSSCQSSAPANCL
ncbi:hypothetical protein ACU686_36595 [Yinghuangia aomiensis]